MLDMQAFLVGDALADFSLEEHAMALKYATGRCAKVVDTATALTELNESCTEQRVEALAWLRLNSV